MPNPNLGVAPVPYSGPGLVDNTWLAGLLAGINPAPSTWQTYFGGGTNTFLEEGNIYKSPISQIGSNPAGTGGDYVLSVFSLSANSFDIANRMLTLEAYFNVANNTNAKRLKIYWNPTAAVVGSTITGGTVIADTGSYSTTGSAGGQISAQVINQGNGNVECIHFSTQIGSTVSALIASQSLSITSSSTILMAVTGNATTAATDIIFNNFVANAMN